MKALLKSTLLTLFYFASFSVSAQNTDEPPKQSPYLFPDFISATVKRVDIKTIDMLLDYNTFTRELINWKDGQYIVLNLGSADTVIFNNRPFVPVGKEYYEVGTTTPIPLFIQHYSELSAASASSGFGMKSSQTITYDNLTSDIKQQLYDTKLPTNYTIEHLTNYFLRKDGQYLKANNLKQVMAVFPAKADKIKSYAKSNNINFDNSNDIKKLIIYCNSAM